MPRTDSIRQTSSSSTSVRQFDKTNFAAAIFVAASLAIGAAFAAGESPAGESPAAKPTGKPKPNAQPPKTSAITPVPWTPVLVKTSVTPQAFRSTDGKLHIIYDLMLQNFTSNSATLNKLDLLDADGKLVRSYDERQLAPILWQLGQTQKPMEIQAGASAVAFINLDFNKDQDVPEIVRHRVTVSSNMFDPAKQSTFTYEAAPAVVDKRDPQVLGAPVSGGNWLASDSWASQLGHRRALFAVGNKPQSSQCYAIDWIRLDNNNRSLSGPPDSNESNFTYNQPVYAVADGTISGVIDKFPDQKPNHPSGGNDRFDYPAGNAIVEDLGGDLFVLYAHLKPGSIKVKEGQKVKRGQPIGAVGNSGNSSGAHLHMHVMDGPHPIAANAVPYLFDTFKVVGQVKDMQKAEESAAHGLPQKVEHSEVSGDHKHELPRQGCLIVFPELQTH